MNIVDQKVIYEYLQTGEEMAKSDIEKSARICYKSEGKIKDGTSDILLNNLINNNHYAMLEHGAVYLKIHRNKIKKVEIENIINNPYTRVICFVDGYYMIATNLRVVKENCWEKYLRYSINPTEDELKSLVEKGFDARMTCKVTTCIQVAQEILRNRVFSFAQESTRWCNYSSGKFNGELSFIIPEEAKNNKIAKLLFKIYYKISEVFYRIFTKRLKLQSQTAAFILPKGLKADMEITGHISDWEGFFDKRLFEKTGKVLPEMKILAKEIYDKLV